MHISSNKLNRQKEHDKHQPIVIIVSHLLVYHCFAEWFDLSQEWKHPGEFEVCFLDSRSIVVIRVLKVGEEGLEVVGEDWRLLEEGQALIEWVMWEVEAL